MHVCEVIFVIFIIRTHVAPVLIDLCKNNLSLTFQVDLFREITFRNSQQTYQGIPVMASNMDTVGTFEMAKALSKVKGNNCQKITGFCWKMAKKSLSARLIYDCTQILHHRGMEGFCRQKPRVPEKLSSLNGNWKWRFWTVEQHFGCNSGGHIHLHRCGQWILPAFRGIREKSSGAVSPAHHYC